MSNITTIIFDFGGVLINLDINLCIRNFEKLGVENPEQYIGSYGQAGFFLQWEKGEIDLMEFRNKVREISSGNPTDEDIDAAWCSFLLDVPEHRIKLLLELKKKYRLLLLSNSNPLHIEVNAKKEFGKYGLDIRDVFDKCFISYEMGVTKPDPAIFNRLLSEAGVSAEECLFLDDGQKNIDVAKKLGINSLLTEQGQNLDFLLKQN